MSQLLSVATLAESLRIAVPYACAPAGGVWAERSGAHAGQAFVAGVDLAADRLRQLVEPLVWDSQ